MLKFYTPMLVILTLIFGIHPAIGREACAYFNDFQDNGNGTITDPRNGLVWQKCVVGQTWGSSGCKGQTTPMSWDSAMQAARDNRFLAKSDWRIPTINEFRLIIGDDGDCGNENSAVSRKLWYPKSKQEVGDEDFWSSTKTSDNWAWLVSFHNGGMGGDFINYQRGVRLVRHGESTPPPHTKELKSTASSPEVIAPLSNAPCIFKPVMTDEEIELCRGR